jgi:hypothetical protein
MILGTWIWIMMMRGRKVGARKGNIRKRVGGRE